MSTWTAPTPPATAEGRFALIMSRLMQVVATVGWQRGAPAGLLILIGHYLARLRNRFAALAARVRAGTLPTPRTRVAREVAEDAEAPPPPPPAAWQMPRGFGWLVHLGGYHAAIHGSQLVHLLEDPEFQALLRAAPQMARLLRPLFWALNKAPGPDLLPPPAARARRAASPPPCNSMAEAAPCMPDATPAPEGKPAPERPAENRPAENRPAQNRPVQNRPARLDWASLRPVPIGRIVYRD